MKNKLLNLFGKHHFLHHVVIFVAALSVVVNWNSSGG